jgi:hypothetical protein
MTERRRRVDLPAEVVELLQDEPGLLAIADALRASNRGRSRRRLVSLALVAAVGAVVLAVAGASFLLHSSKRDGVIARAAEAAQGSRLTLVASVVSKGRRVELEGRYEPALGEGRAVVHLQGVDKLASPRLPQVRTLLDRFAIGYQRTLRAGRAELTASTGSTLWLRLGISGVDYQVALDRDTYRPVLIRVVPPGASAAVTLDVMRFAVS